MYALHKSKKTHYAVLCAILILSSYVHLYNAAGFPDIFFDEGIYMRRAMTVLDTGNPQEGSFYDHPYFGQLFLAGVLALAGFPESVEKSLEVSYMAPRVLMGLLAVLDTFLIYQITERRFGRRAAILSSILFAAMPVTWMFRRILLDSILMPLLLSSILLALHSKDSRHQGALVLGSSVLLGLAIFTKLTAVTMIPLVAYLIVSGSGSRWLAKWFTPVVAIPSVWPAAALHMGHLGYWFRDVLWQAGRGTGQFLPLTYLVFWFDPVFFSLGFIGLAYAAFKRNIMLVLWIVPFLAFVSQVGFFQYFHYMLVIPGMCIAAALLLDDTVRRIQRVNVKYVASVLAVLVLGVYGGVVSTLIISNDMTSAQFSAMQYVVETFDGEEFTLLSPPAYSWIISSIHGHENVFLDHADILFYEPETEYVYLVVDGHVLFDQNRGQRLVDVVEGTNPVKTFALDDLPDSDAFPFHSFERINEGNFVEIKTDREQLWP